MKHLTFFLVLIFALSACKSVDKLYQEGNYKQILSKLEGKAKKGKLDRKEKSLLIKAMNKYGEEINSYALTSLAASKPSDWNKAKKRLFKLDDKIAEVQSYSQIKASDINSSRLDELEPQLNEKLYDYTITQYDAAIANYDRTKDRDYAQKAYAHAEKLYDYNGDPKTIESLSLIAVDLGHRTIYVDVDGPFGDMFIFDNNFERQLDFDNDLFNTFTEFRVNDSDYDLEIDVEITRRDSDESSRSDRYTKRVIDYYDNVVDTATNSTNEIPVYKDIEAIVETIEIVRYVEGEYEYELRDNRNGRRFDYGSERRRIEEREVIYVLESGDEEAVPSNIQLSNGVFRNERNSYDDMLEELYRELVNDFNSDVNIKSKLH